jgi:hypothetical protein
VAQIRMRRGSDIGCGMAQIRVWRGSHRVRRGSDKGAVWLRLGFGVAQIRVLCGSDRVPRGSVRVHCG